MTAIASHRRRRHRRSSSWNARWSTSWSRKRRSRGTRSSRGQGSGLEAFGFRLQTQTMRAMIEGSSPFFLVNGHRVAVSATTHGPARVTFCNGLPRCMMPLSPRALDCGPSQRVVIRCGIPLRRACSRPDTTFAGSRVSWGHREVAATMIYTHVLKRGAGGVRSPLDE